MGSNYAQTRPDWPLPINPLSSSSHSAEQTPEQLLLERFAGKTVLVVDDNEINREIGVDLLDLAGLKVRTAVDGLDALQFVSKQHCDLILMDIDMPRMDGIEATWQIRQLPQCKRIPIIALTADDRFHDHQLVVASGMNESLSKPIDPDLLYATIFKWLSIRQFA